MTYLVKLHPKVQKFIDKSDKQLGDRLLTKLRLLKENPFKHLEHFEGDDFYKLRIGDYRALIDLDIVSKIVLVRHLEHRSKVYKR